MRMFVEMIFVVEFIGEIYSMCVFVYDAQYSP